MIKKHQNNIDYQNRITNKKAYIMFSIIGFAFFFFAFTGSLLAKKGNIIWNAKYFITVLGASVILGSVTGIAICKLMMECNKWWKVKPSNEPSFLRSLNTGRLFFLSWGLLAISWFPGFLAYYPAICSYDTPPQLTQIAGGVYIDHHPLAHTMLLKGFITLGREVWQSMNVGIAMFAFLQMLFLSAAFALAITMLRILGARWKWLFALFIYGVFFPFHMYMSITITKDTIFTVFFMLQLLILYNILYKKRNDFKIDKWDIGFFICTLGMILFRNNGRYALLVLITISLPVILFSKKNKKIFTRILLNSVMGFVMGSIMLTVVFRIMHAEPGDKREMLSMPIQQLSRCMVYHGGAGVLPEDDNTMNDVDKALINDFILNDAYKMYRGDISDPVKRHTNTYVFRYRFKDFMKTYFHLLGQYPGDYINAVLAVNAGYLYPGDESHAYINVNHTERGLGYIQTRWAEAELASLDNMDFYKDSKWEWMYEKLEDYADNNAYLKVPILKYIFVPGSYLWLYLLLAAYLILYKRYSMLLPLSLVLGYYITLFLGPTVQLRYIYPIMVSLPFIFVWCITTSKKRGELND